MLVTLDGSGPLALQLYRALRAQILAGVLAPGARLPSTRGLAAASGVSRNTVLLAYGQLLSEGYATGRRGSGTYVPRELPETMIAVGRPHGLRPAVARRPPRLSRRARRIGAAHLSWAPRAERVPYDFRYGRPAFADFPHATWRRLQARRIRRVSDRDLDYGPPAGAPPLREAIADYLRRARAVRATADEVIIVSGSQQGLDLCARVLLDPGARVLLEEPHYPGARGVFGAAGATIVSAPVGNDGIDIATLRDRANRVRLAYVTPSHQFPTGALMPLARRLALLRWAERTGAYVVEDDYDSEYRYVGRPVEALQGLDGAGRVIYLGTFSKLLFPALRLGYLVVPAPLTRAFANAKALADTGCATLDQLALADFIRGGHFERHIRRARARNAVRRAAVLDAIAAHLGDRVDVQAADAGIHVLLWLRDVPAQALRPLLGRAEAHGVRVYPVTPCYRTPPRRAGVILGYAGLGERQIRDGVRLLAEAWSTSSLTPRSNR
jgi:GntR family transcriptional regulator/MocR family aminotransferase